MKTPSSYLEIGDTEFKDCFPNNAVHVLNTIHFASTGNCTWSEIMCTRNAPDPRCGSAFTNRDNFAYVFGGDFNSFVQTKKYLKTRTKTMAW